MTLTLFVATGQLLLSDLIEVDNYLALLLSFATLLVIGLLFFVFRDKVLTLPLASVVAITSVHTFRNGFAFVLQILQWWVVYPEAPLSVWATMLAVMIVTSRLPFIPAKDLTAIGMILGLSSFLDAPADVISGLLLSHAALNHGANFAVMGVSSFWTPAVSGGPEAADSIPSITENPDHTPQNEIDTKP